jgi:hypothetical protein
MSTYTLDVVIVSIMTRMNSDFFGIEIHENFGVYSSHGRRISKALTGLTRSRSSQLGSDKFRHKTTTTSENMTAHLRRGKILRTYANRKTCRYSQTSNVRLRAFEIVAVHLEVVLLTPFTGSYEPNATSVLIPTSEPNSCI